MRSAPSISPPPSPPVDEGCGTRVRAGRKIEAKGRMCAKLCRCNVCEQELHPVDCEEVHAEVEEADPVKSPPTLFLFPSQSDIDDTQG